MVRKYSSIGKEKNNDKLIEEALKDEVVENLKVLGTNSKEIIKSLLESRMDNFYLGEWESKLGRIVYTYRIHSQEKGDKLKKLIEEGYKFKRPELTLYSRQDLLDYIKKVA